MSWSNYWNTIDGIRALGDTLQFAAIAIVLLGAFLGALTQAAKQVTARRERVLVAEAAARKEKAFNETIETAQRDAKDAQERAERAKEDATRAQELATRDVAKPAAPSLAESTHSALAAWHAKHPDVRLVLNVWGTNTLNVPQAVDSVAGALGAAGIEVHQGQMIGMFGTAGGASPLGPEIQAPEELGPAADGLRKALSGLTPGASIAAQVGGAPKTISLTFRGAPSFAPDGSITFR